MLKTVASSTINATTTLITCPNVNLHCSSYPLSGPFLNRFTKSTKQTLRPLRTLSKPFATTTMNILNKLGFGSPRAQQSSADASIAQGPDDDVPAPGQEFAQFGAGCFWGVELAFQRVAGVKKTEVGYTQGFLHNPSYEDVCSGTTNHSEVVRVHYDPKECSFDTLLDVFWARHDPTTLNRQVGFSGFCWNFVSFAFWVFNCEEMWYGFLLFWLVKVDFLSNVGGFVWSYGNWWLICVLFGLFFLGFGWIYLRLVFVFLLAICLSSAMWTKLGVWWI